MISEGGGKEGSVMWSVLAFKYRSSACLCHQIFTSPTLALIAPQDIDRGT